MDFEKTTTNKYIPIKSSELTTKQLLNLTQPHISTTYDLRTHRHSSDKEDNLEFHNLPLQNTDNQNIDLFEGDEATPNQAIQLQENSQGVQNNNQFDTLRPKPYMTYLVDNSENEESRRPTLRPIP
jgi:hypothetical protein